MYKKYKSHKENCLSIFKCKITFCDMCSKHVKTPNKCTVFILKVIIDLEQSLRICTYIRM